MTKEDKSKKHQRDDSTQPVVLPGIHRYQFFSNIRDRTLTKNLNRLCMLGIGTALAVDIVKPLLNADPQTIFCYECRACYATQDKCPAAIPFQAELVVASRVLDYNRFIRNGGLNCVRCGACQSFCVVNLELPRIFGTMQQKTMAAIKEGAVSKGVMVHALKEGLINREFINAVAGVVGA